MKPWQKPRVVVAPVTRRHENARELLLNLKIQSAVMAYARSGGRRGPVSRSEYAWVLALAGLGEMAMDQLDELSGGNPLGEADRWIAGEVYRSLGSSDLADSLQKGLDRPDWFSGKELAKLRAKALSRPEKPAKGVKSLVVKANQLMGSGSHYRAVAAFEQAVAADSKTMIIRVGHSLALERIGAFDAAQATLDIVKTRATGRSRSMINKRLEQVNAARKAQAGGKRQSVAKSSSRSKGRFMIFGGGNMTTVEDISSTNLNGRLGYFVADSLDLGIDLGTLSTPDGTGGTTSSFLFGVSSRVYFPVAKEASVVLGTRLARAADSTLVTISPGFSSPVGDIFIDLTFGSSFSLGMTVGLTTYLGGSR